MSTFDQQAIESKVLPVQHGFKEMKQAAQEMMAADYAPAELFALAQDRFRSKHYQVRMVATFVFGYLAFQHRNALMFLRERVSLDASWQVQEILAQAFNQYCQDVGYEKALPEIQSWLEDDNPNVKRAVTEGLRIWNQRDYFRQHPEVAVQLLSRWRGHESEYLRKSVGNALRDISRKEKDLVQKELETWDLSDNRILFTYKLACKFL